MITNNKNIEIFCVVDKSYKNFDTEIEKNILKGLLLSEGKKCVVIVRDIPITSI